MKRERVEAVMAGLVVALAIAAVAASYLPATHREPVQDVPTAVELVGQWPPMAPHADKCDDMCGGDKCCLKCVERDTCCCRHWDKCPCPPDARGSR